MVQGELIIRVEVSLIWLYGLWFVFMVKRIDCQDLTKVKKMLTKDLTRGLKWYIMMI